MRKTRVNRNDLLVSWLFTILKLTVYFIFIFFLFRLFFVFYYGDIESLSSKPGDLFLAFVYGARYDLIVISYAMAPIFLLALFTPVFRSSKLKNFLNSFLRIYAVLLSFVFVSVLASDMGFYLYFQDHINILIYGVIEDDTMALIETIWKNYPVIYFGVGILIFLVVSSFIVIKLTPMIRKYRSYLKSGFMTYALISFIFFLLYAGAIRGGYSKVVLAPKYNDFSSNEFINIAAMNGFLALENAVRLRQSSEGENYNLARTLGYKNGVGQAFSDYLGLDMSLVKQDELLFLLKRKTSKNIILEDKKPHVIVIMSESYGGYWNKFNSTDFNFLGGLEKHFAEDYYFKNFVSGANGTVGSLMIVASNIPYRPGARFLSESKYLQVPLDSSAHIPFKTSGYETNFLYGGKLGWRDIGKYFGRQNYTHIIGENEIKDELKLTGKQGTEWGVYDEHLFSMIKKIITNAKRPQFILALTTTNHPPFEVPKTFNASELVVPALLNENVKREREIIGKRFRAFQYANNSFSNFLDFIKKSDLADKTIVSMTGDHNFWGFVNFGQNQTYEKHLVPFYVYLPEDLKIQNVDLNKVGSHEDIMTTLYNVSLSDTDYLSFGENLFSPSESYAINQKIYASSRGVVYKNKDFEWNGIPLINENSSEPFLNNLRRHYRSSLTVSDYFLQRSLEKFNTEK